MSKYFNIPLSAPMPPANQLELADRAGKGCEASAWKLALANVRMILKEAHKWTSWGVPLDDLTHEGLRSMYGAALRWDSQRRNGAKFTSYAMHSVRRRMHVVCRQLGKQVKRPDRGNKKLEQINLDAPTATIDPDCCMKALNASTDPWKADLRHNLFTEAVLAMGCLPERDQRILFHRFIAGQTLTKTGEIMGISKERVRQLQNSALKKLRKQLKPLI